MTFFTLRPETPADFAEIHELIKHAFENAEHSDHQEQFLVERLRKDPAFLPTLAWVAVNKDGEIIGHIAFSEAVIADKKVLALAPLSVRPDYQKQGVGTALIHQAHAIINTLNYPAAIVLGHPDYYAKFGYENAKEFDITASFDVPDGVLRVWKISDTIPQGTIQYAQAFGI